jgi:4-hydroxy-3-methylbut-2-en-1-yl diphosphate reductase
VVGSKTSANTQRLIEIVASDKGNVKGVETEQDINQDWFNKDIKVGLISGTSAPRWLINKVVEKLNEIKENYDKKDF